MVPLQKLPWGEHICLDFDVKCTSAHFVYKPIIPSQHLGETVVQICSKMLQMCFWRNSNYRIMNKIGKFIAKLTKKEKKIQSLTPGSKRGNTTAGCRYRKLIRAIP